MTVVFNSQLAARPIEAMLPKGLVVQQATGAVAEAARAAADSLASAASQITNDEISALLPELQDMFTQTAEVMDSVASGDLSQIGDAAEIGESFQVTVTKFQELCAP